MNILIVEDDREKLQNIRETMEHIGNVRIDAAANYFSARHKIYENRSIYDLIILDMYLPDASDTDKIRGLAGKELAFDMQDEGIEIPFIIVTQYTDYGKAYVGREWSTRKIPPYMENPDYGKELSETRRRTYDCTYYEGLHEYLKDEIPFYLGIVYYTAQHGEWADCLRMLACKVWKGKNMEIPE